METTNAIQQIYIGLLGRAADQEGLQYWTNEIEAGTLTLEQLRANIVEEQPEYEATFGGQTRAQVVTQLYANLFNRAPDNEGLQYWVNGEGASVNIDQLVLALVNGAAAADTLVLDNRTEVANYYTTELGAEGSFNAELAAAVVADVDGTRASVTQAKAAVDNNDISAPTPNEGQTFTLTDATGENVVGTSGNDTFNAVHAIDGSTPPVNSGTIQAGDTINGAGGTDTLNLLVADGTGGLAPGFSVSNVEVVNISYVDGQDLGDLNSSTFAGVEQLWQIDNDATSNDFQNVTVGAGVTAGFRSTGVNATATDASVILSAANNTQDALSVALDGTGAATFDLRGTGVETLNVSGSIAEAAATNVLELNDAGAAATPVGSLAGSANIETVNLALTSNTTVDFDTSGAFVDVTAINASASTGGLTVNTTGRTALETATFGSGADTVTVDSTASTKDQVTIDLGAGNDTLITAVGGANGGALSATLGAGKDTVQVVNALDNIQDVADLEASMITIEDFNVGEDTLDFKAVGTATLVTLSAAQLDTFADTATLADATEAVMTFLDGDAATAAVFNYGDNAYVAVDTASTAGTGENFTAGDGLIELMGVDAAALSTDQNGGLLV
jgi:hypothetical protein